MKPKVLVKCLFACLQFKKKKKKEKRKLYKCSWSSSPISNSKNRQTREKNFIFPSGYHSNERMGRSGTFITNKRLNDPGCIEHMWLYCPELSLRGKSFALNWYFKHAFAFSTTTFSFLRQVFQQSNTLFKHHTGLWAISSTPAVWIYFNLWTHSLKTFPYITQES